MEKKFSVNIEINPEEVFWNMDDSDAKAFIKDKLYILSDNDLKCELEKRGINTTIKENKKLNDNLGNELAILSAYIISGEWSEAHISRALGIIKELEKLKVE